MRVIAYAARRTGVTLALAGSGALSVIFCASPLVFVSLLVSGTAHAEEPVAAAEPRLMSETAEVTSVVDAFDRDDPFDVNLTLGFQQTWKTAQIRRETAINQAGLSTGGFVPANENVASYSHSVSTLNMGADVGIYKDIALIFRLPLILSDNRSMDDLDGSSKNQTTRLADPSGAPLFSLPFKSPTRSGVDYFMVGLNWAIYNQQRDDTKPTWVIGVDGRFGVGTPLHACNANAAPGVPQCPDPSWKDSKNAAGNVDGTVVNGAKLASRDPGISRAMDAIEIHTIFSRRFGYVEPYTGFKALVEFAQSGSDFGQTNSLQGALLSHPPLQGTFLMGLEVIPWERREQFQRLVGDFRISGAYHSAGREYSELFDALGSSQAPSLRAPNPSSFKSVNGQSQGDPNSQQVYFSGITDQQAYGSLSLLSSATWQAGEYIKFVAGLGMTFNQSHLITSADSCNPDFKGDASAAGPCHGVPNATGGSSVTGIPNPNHRDVIDLPGHRFSVDGTTIVDLFVQGVVMF